MTSEITKQFIDENLSQVEQKLVASMQSLYDLMIERKDSPLQILDPARELQDSPVGSILTYMGNSAPPHYLACDGSIYNISDYPALANHIKNEFKSYNKFGGNGTTTFAVPDLRGEFLRGGGTALRNTGSGAGIGEHQDPTHIQEVIAWGEDIYLHINKRSKDGNNNPYARNHDQIIGSRIGSIIAQTKQVQTLTVQTDGMYSARPTNTSVLYCIKYEPTWYMHIEPSIGVYSYKEVNIGTFNGEPLYRRCFDFSFTENNTIIPFAIENLDEVISIYGSIQGTNRMGSNYAIPIAYCFTDSAAKYYIATVFNISNNELKLFVSDNFIGGVSSGTATIIIEYTKTA